jgi:hypothetical protein
MAEALGHPASLLIACWGTGAACLRRGDAARAVALAERALEICRDVGLPMYFHYIGSVLGPAYALTGEIDRSVAMLEEVVEQDRRVGLLVNYALTLAALGEAELLAGRPNEAASRAEEALAISSERREPGH